MMFREIMGTTNFPIWHPFSNDWWTFATLFLMILCLVGISELTLRFKWWSSHTNRKLVHIIVGLLVSITPLIFENRIQPALLAAIFIILNGIALRKHSFKGIHSQEQKSYGTVFFPLGFLIVVVCFWNYPIYIIISMTILALSDPMAAFVGQKITNPKRYIIWAETKSIEGSITMLVSSMLLTWGIILFFFPDNHAFFYIMIAFFTGITAMVSEGLSFRGSDNLSIPILIILFLEIFLSKTAEGTVIEYLKFAFLIIFIFIIAYRNQSLTEDGLIGAMIMGLLIYGLGGYQYLVPLFIFFILSSILSHIIIIKPKDQHLRPRRNIIQVYSNGGIAMILVIMDHFNPQPWIYPAFIASVTTAMADTWGTEIGKLSSRKPVDIITFKSLQTGDSGGITMVGTIGSLFGAIVLGLVGYVFGIPGTITLLIILSGFASALFDSIIGGTVQARFICCTTSDISEKGAIKNRKGYLYTGWNWINNDMVNLLSTICGPCLFVILLYYLS